MLWAVLACTDLADSDVADSDPSEDSEHSDPPGVTVYGSVVDAFTREAVEGLRVEGISPPAEPVFTDAQGIWTLLVPESEWMMARSGGDGLVEVALWIKQREGPSMEQPYSYGIGTPEQLAQLHAMVGSSADPSRSALLMVDAIDPDNRDIPNALVHLDVPYEAAHREVQDGVWDNEPLTTPDRTDLFFTGLEEGPLTVTVTQPDGQACEGPTGVVVMAGEVTQISSYCPDRVEE